MSLFAIRVSYSIYIDDPETDEGRCKTGSAEELILFGTDQDIATKHLATVAAKLRAALDASYSYYLPKPIKHFWPNYNDQLSPDVAIEIIPITCLTAALGRKVL